MMSISIWHTSGVPFSAILFRNNVPFVTEYRSSGEIAFHFEEQYWESVKALWDAFKSERRK
jgi:hypothetical protein